MKRQFGHSKMVCQKVSIRQNKNLVYKMFHNLIDRLYTFTGHILTPKSINSFDFKSPLAFLYCHPKSKLLTFIPTPKAVRIAKTSKSSSQYFHIVRWKPSGDSQPMCSVSVKLLFFEWDILGNCDSDSWQESNIIQLWSPLSECGGRTSLLMCWLQ